MMTEADWEAVVAEKIAEIDRLRKLELSAKLLVGVWERYRGILPEPIIDELVRLREAIDADTMERLASDVMNRTRTEQPQMLPSKTDS